MSFKKKMSRSSKKSKKINKNETEQKSITQSNVKLVVNEKKGNKNIPSYEYIDNPSFTSVIFNCKEGQGIVADNDKMNYMIGDFDVKTSSRGGILKGLKRLATSSSMFETTYTSISPNSKISLSHYLPGDMFSLTINPDDRIVFGSNSLVCMSNNVQVQTRFRAKGLFTKESAFINDLVIDKRSNQSGMAWISSYGGYKKISLAPEQKFVLSGGLFLAAHSHVRYKLVRLGKSFRKTFLSGEGILMQFIGPAEIYIRTRDIGSFSKFIKQTAKKK
jgi:uncharacterized protein (TIGR00266 family)